MATYALFAKNIPLFYLGMSKTQGIIWIFDDGIGHALIRQPALDWRRVLPKQDEK